VQSWQKIISSLFFLAILFSLSLSLPAASSSTNHLATGLSITSFTMIYQHNHQLATRSSSNNGHAATSFFPLHHSLSSSHHHPYIGPPRPSTTTPMSGNLHPFFFFFFFFPLPRDSCMQQLK
jgi:hypothetical protein